MKQDKLNYLKKHCKGYNLSIEEGLKHALVQEVFNYYDELDIAQGNNVEPIDNADIETIKNY